MAVHLAGGGAAEVAEPLVMDAREIRGIEAQSPPTRPSWVRIVAASK
jgi:hypothetical protein